MPAAKPLEFRRGAVELAHRREKPIAGIAHALRVVESCLWRWLEQDDIDAGRAEGLSTDERAESVRLRRCTPTRLGLGLACGRKRVARLKRTAGLTGVCHRRRHRRADPLPAVHADLDQPNTVRPISVAPRSANDGSSRPPPRAPAAAPAPGR
jgi:transposase-like protein